MFAGLMLYVPWAGKMANEEHPLKKRELIKMLLKVHSTFITNIGIGEHHNDSRDKRN